MSTPAIALDPAETIAAAVRTLYDHLKKIVDRGPPDDDQLPMCPACQLFIAMDYPG